MTENHAGRELAKWVAVTLAILVGGYVAAYCAMVEPIKVSEDVGIWTRGKPPPAREGVLADYRIIGRRGWTFFAPVHWIDQRLRPRVWGDPRDTEAVMRSWGFDR